MVKKRVKKKKASLNFKEEYRKSWEYLKLSKNFLYIVTGVFLFVVLVGVFVPTPEYFSEQILEFIRQLLEKTSGMSTEELMKFILFNNVKSSFFGMIFGIILGIFPMITVIVNGYLIGFVSALSVQSEGISILWRLVPHGIFELPALIISLGIGLKLGTFLFQKEKIETFRDYLYNSLRVFLFIVIPLLVIAAFIEGLLIGLSS